MTTNKNVHKHQQKRESIKAKSDFKTSFQQKDEAGELQDLLIFYFTDKIKRTKIEMKATGKMVIANHLNTFALRKHKAHTIILLTRQRTYKENIVNSEEGARTQHKKERGIPLIDDI